MHRQEATRRRWRLRLVAVGATAVAAIVAVAIYAHGSGHTAAVLPWFLPATGTLLFVMATSVAFLAFGRYRVTSDAASFWVGVGSYGFAVGMLFNTLTFPGLLPQGGQIMGRLGNTAGWEGTFALWWLGIALLLAAALPWPGESAPRPANWRVAIGVGLAAMVGLHLLFVFFEEHLPVVISPVGTFTPLFRALNGFGLGIVSGVGTVLAVRRSSRSADPLTAYIALCQLAFLAVAILSALEVRRWDIFWYVQRLLWVGGFVAMFFGLLSEHVNLYRLEREKTEELAAATQELKKSEEELRRSETTLLIAIEATGLGTFDFDPRSGRLVWSDQAKRHFGLPPGAETSYEVFQSALHPDDRERVKGLLRQAMQPGSGGRYHAEYRSIGLLDGKERWLIARGQAFFDGKGEAFRVVGATLDITERKRAENRLRRIFDSGMIGIFYWSLKGEILDANDKFLEMVGKTRAELEAGALGWAELTPPEYHDQDRHALEELEATGLDTPYEKEFLRSDGSRVPVFIGAATLDETGREGVAFVLDITDRKKAEEELRKARDYLEVRVQERTEELSRALRELKTETEERVRAVEELRVREQILMQQNRLAAMGEMLVNISHQWRQPLNVVGLLFQNLSRAYDRGDLTRETLEKNVARGIELIEHMSKTIDDFTQYLSPDRVKSSFDAREVVGKALSMVGETLRNIEVVVRPEAEAPVWVTGHRNEYAQVLINILINARDVFRERGTERPMIEIRAFSENGKSVVTVADNAGGIAADVIDRIFDPYFTTKPPDQGTGIGLFMSRSIIEKSMGGSLTVRNTDAGAEFRIEV